MDYAIYIPGGTMHYQNCWEFKQCGRERTGSAGICPAALSRAADGVNGGINAGRVCWAVTGTLCDGKRQGTYAEKVMECMSCDFRLKVMEEMSYKFKPVFF
ncbi:MAG: hypothetical protein P8013_07690 [Candidatus Sulfobium sp.]